MKSLYNPIVCFALLVMATSLAADTNIGYFDMKRILDNAPHIIAGRNKLDLEFRARNDDVLHEETNLEKMESQLLRDGALMAESEKTVLERRIRSLRRDVRRMREDLQDEFDIRLNEEYVAVQETLKDAVRIIAQKEKYDLILTSPVPYASERIDITGQLLDYLQQHFDSKTGK